MTLLSYSVLWVLGTSEFSDHDCLHPASWASSLANAVAISASMLLAWEVVKRQLCGWGIWGAPWRIHTDMCGVGEKVTGVGWGHRLTIGLGPPFELLPSSLQQFHNKIIYIQTPSLLSSALLLKSCQAVIFITEIIHKEHDALHAVTNSVLGPQFSWCRRKSGCWLSSPVLGLRGLDPTSLSLKYLLP